MVTILVVTLHLKKKNLTSLFQKLSNTNSSPVRGGTLCPPLPSIQEFGLAWAYISLVHAVTAAMSSYDHNCYAVSRKEFSSSHPLPLSLRIFLTPFPWRFMTLGVTGIVIKQLNELLLYPQVSASLNPLSCSRSHLTQRPTTDQFAENEKLGRSQPCAGYLCYTLLFSPLIQALEN